MSVFELKNGMLLEILPVNKMLLLPIREKFQDPPKPPAPINHTAQGDFENPDDPEYEKILALWELQKQEVIQDVYVEFGIEDFDFDLSKVEKHRAKFKKLFDTELTKSDKRVFLEFIACQDEDEYSRLLTEITKVSEPTAALGETAREMFPANV